MATRHTIGVRDNWFIGDRIDPYSHKVFEIGETIVICGACKSPHLEDTWGQNPNRPCSVCDGNGALLEFDVFNEDLFRLRDTGNGILRQVRHFDPEAQVEAQRLEIVRQEAELRRLEEEQQSAGQRRELALQAEQELNVGNERLEELSRRQAEIESRIQEENEQVRETRRRIIEAESDLELRQREIRAVVERRESILREVQEEEAERIIEAQVFNENQHRRVELLHENRERQQAERIQRAVNRASAQRMRMENRRAQILESRLSREIRR